MSPRLPSWTVGVLGSAGLVALWWLAAVGTGAVGRVVPTPLEVAQQFLTDGWAFHWRNLRVTLVEAGQGYLWGNGVALALAAVVLVLPRWARLIEQLGVISYCIPIVALGPIVFIVVGPPATGQPSATASALAALAVFFTTLVGATTAFRAADRAALDVVTVSGGGALARLRKVQLVSAVPGILAALRIAAPAALLGAIIGEYLGGVDRGLGPAMINAQQSLLFPRIWAIALVCSAVAGLAYAALGILARVFAPWAPAAEGSAR